MDNVMKVEFINMSCNEKFARGVAVNFAAMLDPTIEELTDIKTAVSEAVTNAIIHGYAGRYGTVVMEGRISGRKIEFVIRDFGCGIADIAKAREPMYTDKPEMERSGMGFTIMETFMDEFSVESTVGAGTVITMSKTLQCR